MCTNNWPMLLDLSRDECKRILRSLELNAYSTVITAFRAQGDLSQTKKAILQDLQNILSISTERHRAEVRRATNDEKLSTIADNVSGSDVCSEWSIEGRRLVPLMPRLVPQTAFTVTANSAANAQAEKNLTLPLPSHTGNKDPNAVPPPVSSPPPNPGNASPRLARPASPNSNVVVLPSGMAIHIKGSLSAGEEEEGSMAKKRRRSSSSSESLILSKPAAAATPMLMSKPPTVVPSTHSSISPLVTTAMTLPQGQSTPMKITFTKSPAKTHTTVTPSQKVILVSSSQSGTSNILQRSLNVPMAKTTCGVTTATTATMYTQRSSVVMTPQPSPSVTNGNLGNIITVATSNAMPSSSALGSSPYVTSNLSAIRPRTKTITATRPRATISARSGMVIPVGAQQLSQTTQNIHIKSVSKPPIHIKQEGGMKIITQGLPSSKIAPKPMVGQMTTGRVLNITQGGRVIATSRTTAANVVTVNPKTLQLTAIKGASGATVLSSAGRVATATGAKPNVIVVQKAQPKRAQTPTTPTIQVTKTGPGTSPFEKELMSFIQKQDTMKTNIKGSIIERKTLVAKPGDPQKRMPMVVRQRIDPNMSEASRSSLLAELINAVGIGPDGTPEIVTSQSQEVIVRDYSTSESQNVVIPAAQTEVITVTARGADGHHWVDYEESQMGAPGIKSLLTSQHTPMPMKTRIISAKPGDLDNVQLTQIPESQAGAVYHIESGGEAKSLVSSDVHYIDLSAQEEVVTTGSQSHPVSVQLTNAADLTNLTSLGQEVLGELDPQTGIFYASATGDTAVSSQMALPSTVTLGSQSVLPLKEGMARGIPEDFLSSALTQAQIDLDSYHFVEEEDSSRLSVIATSAAGDVALTGTPLVSILNPSVSGVSGFPTPPQSSQDTESQNYSQDSESVIVEGEQIDNIVLLDQQEVVETTDTEVEEQPLVPLQESSGDLTISSLPPGIIMQPMPEPRKVVMSREPQIKTITLDQSGKTVMLETPRSIMVESTNRLVGEPLVSPAPGQRRVVTVEELRKFVQSQPPAGGAVRTVQKVIVPSAPATFTGPATSLLANTELVTCDPVVTSDLTSPQPMTEEMEHDLLASPGSGSDSQMDHLGQRLSKRKRKPPPAADDSPPPAGAAQWIRMALGLLQRVCRFRGNKEKGELNASVWFLQPVDTAEVKDYLDVVRSPMDFSTVREQLEAGGYENWSDFHDDMMLVRDNCILYNPDGSTVRNDCDEVFAYFDAEYQKTLERWHKMFASSPGKKMRADKSPARP